MENRIFNYENNNITFSLEKNNGVMVNATEMAKCFGKLVKDFMGNDSTKAFISACMTPENAKKLGICDERDLFFSRQKVGTYFHKILALRFAAWLSPDFELWIYATIEQIIMRQYAERYASYERTMELLYEAEYIKAKEEKTVQDFDRYIEIEKLLKSEQAKRSAISRKAYTETKSI